MSPRKPLLDACQARRICTFNATSELFGKLADLPLPSSVLKVAIAAYAKAFRVNLSESERSPGEFASFGDFFTRELREGCRPISPLADGLVCPADGTLHNFGPIRNGVIPQVKGNDYSVSELIGESDAARCLEQGTYATVYLSPANYHRVHSPIQGRITHCRYIPGALFSVHPLFVNNFKNVFVTNERIPIFIETPRGLVCLVMVAATIVGNITLTFSSLTTNRRAPQATETYEQPLHIEPGTELGAFRLGSTVVLLMEGEWQPYMLAEGMPVRMGSPLFRKN
jgi:phosphatidylserine decarboxylase